jgi:alpha-L-rhamnosidase
MRARTETIYFEPKFTYHGFRYASFSQLWWLSSEQLCQNILAGEVVKAQVLASDLKESGHVSMHSDEWTAIERACVWSTRSNLMGVPTDCPQRDVRCSILFLFDCYSFVVQNAVILC